MARARVFVEAGNTARCRSRMVVPEPLGEVPAWAADSCFNTRSRRPSFGSYRGREASGSVSSSASTRTPSPGLAGVDRHRSEASFAKDLRIQSLEARVKELEAGPETESEASQGEGEDLEGAVSAVLAKSETLLRRMSAIDYTNEPEMQWAAMMSAYEESKEKLSRIESLVQRRIGQLKRGDPELRLCREVRGICISSRTQPRRWAISA
ncbi:unnamed protein product [Effrenium voratum]|uniref:Uncharacterized protein n=1 Tax=Effrenium voratum TaxID=2562239 RepID=A0AA36JS99_9DINO|nr:unnamed protein product [Effrenium voratum]